MSDDRYRLRWKGKILGPYTRREIEQRVQEHDLGMLHEIWHEERWMTLKEFLVPKVSPLSSSPTSKSSISEEDPEVDSETPKMSAPPVWLLSGYLAAFALLFLAMLGWTHTWSPPSGWGSLLGLGLGLVGGLFGLLTFFQEEKKHGMIIVILSILLAFANMMPA